MRRLPRDARILVLGHTGFLGRHLCERLARELPRAGLHGASRSGRPAPGLRARACDLKDAGRLKDLLAEIRPQVVFHLAGPPGGRDPQALIEGHLLTTAALLKALRDLPEPRPRLVLPGSAAEYGLAPRRLLPLKEDAPANPLTAYGVAKLAQTGLAQVFAREGLDMVVARVFNVLGPGLDAGISAASFSRQVAEIERGLRPPLIEAGNLSPKRDFVDVADVTRALVLLAARGEPGRVYNVCTGRSVSIRALITGLIRLSGRPIRLQVRSDRVRGADIPDLRGDPGRMARELGWRAEVPLEESLKSMLEHDRARLAAPLSPA